MSEGELVVLAADGNIKQAVEGILGRHESLGVRPVQAAFYVHPEHDPGCLLRSDSFLRAYAQHFQHALVIFDREGCGSQTSAAELSANVEGRLSVVGWEDRAAAVVCDPEVDRWVWSPSPHVEEKLGWSGRPPPGLRDWLVSNGFPNDATGKPERPKEALEAALRLAGKPRSSSLYGQIARSVSLTSCTDPSFLKLVRTLQAWFPKVRQEAGP